MPFVDSVEGAASYLNVSKGFVRALIAAGRIESVGPESVTLQSIIDYKHQDDATRRAAAEELTRISQEMDLP